MNKQVEVSVQDSARNKPYEKPEVTTFGSVAKLTLGGVGSLCDGAAGKAGKSNGGHPC
ncbi:MAG TPA: lasso RiPP family leader peptide-containing protein [Acidobacteriaceae bacterium]|nr:lasso RiPP family leader peptide-containing protein [Acidobacteriaceae bacterium]